MNKETYLSLETIQNFIQWCLPKINEENQFKHSYHNNRSKRIWECNSIFNAFENYEWRFSCSIPSIGKVKGSTYAESKLALEQIQKGLKDSIEQRNKVEILKYSSSILEWGGVKRSNYDRLVLMDEKVIDYYSMAKSQMDPKTVDLKDDFSNIIMNSGFTKIYSLIIDDFIIYDSRVGAALAILIREFLKEFDIPKIPSELNFAYGKSRPTVSDTSLVNKRNPSDSVYKFSSLRNDNKHHTINNLKANWLVKELAMKSKFQNQEDSIRALEAALFMIGYSVNE